MNSVGVVLLRRYFVAELCAAGELAAADTTDAADAVAVPPPAPLSLPRVGGGGASPVTSCGPACMMHARCVVAV